MNNRPDIFDVIKRVNTCDIEYFDNLSDAEVKQIYPLVLMKWLSGVRDSKQITLLNDIVNTTCFQLYKHPKLLYKMLMASCINKGKVSWIKRPSKATDNEILKLVSNYYDCSLNTARQYLPLLNSNDIVDIAESIGMDKKELTKINKLYESKHGM